VRSSGKSPAPSYYYINIYFNIKWVESLMYWFKRQRQLTACVNNKLGVQIQISGSPLGRPQLPFRHVQPQNRHPPPLVPTQYLPLKHQPLDKHTHTDTHTHSHTYSSIYYSLKRSPFSLAKRPTLLIILCINKWQICAT